MTSNRSGHIRLNSHPGGGAAGRFPIQWGAETARERGPVIGSAHAGADRNAIGAHGGAYSLYRALAISSGAMSAGSRPDLTNTQPTFSFGPFAQWTNAEKIVSLDPWGHLVADAFAESANTDQCAADAVPDGWMALDIGPKSIETFRAAILRSISAPGLGSAAPSASRRQVVQYVGGVVARAWVQAVTSTTVPPDWIQTAPSA